jgi:hypothetical protein
MSLIAIPVACYGDTVWYNSSSTDVLFDDIRKAVLVTFCSHYERFLKWSYCESPNRFPWLQHFITCWDKVEVSERLDGPLLH